MRPTTERKTIPAFSFSRIMVAVGTVLSTISETRLARLTGFIMGYSNSGTALAIAILIAAGLVPARNLSASTRPHYGGTVRILVQHKIQSLDPGVEIEYPADREKLASL